MKPLLSLLFATTALTLSVGLPAVAAIRATTEPPGLCAPAACVAVVGDADQAMPLVQVDDDHRKGGWFGLWHDDDDDEDDDDDCDDDDDDDDECGPRKANPAPAGTVAPPANGLFGNGAPPKAVTN